MKTWIIKKNTLLTALLLCGMAASPATAQQENTGELIVEISGAVTNEGKILWRMFADKSDFDDPEEGGVAEGSCEPVDGVCTFTLPNLSFGDYAILAGHDVNNDQEISRNPFSDERKGVTNYTERMMWFPKFEKAKFLHQSPSTKVGIMLF